MKEQISAIMDKLLSKAMEIVESEKAQKLLASPQAQKAMEVGVAALGKVAAARDAAKASIAANLGLATQKDLDSLRESLNKVEEKVAAADKADDKADDNNDEGL